ncbi:creatininase family protein [Nisaea acidiphila]|uniref:Creatininase family protein n=1 Tax=Nisaea acidiphila TaxID=1862145 RepID=A0A9J7AUW7_9PROT|nr:creatininase family protein [Nisaea acidiphila]UUX49205.1 creatininase family protein [Nisaea acidiphila]
MPVRIWGHQTTEEFSTLDPARTIAVLPVGAVEQHGPHLPLSTDILITEAVLDAAAVLLADDVTVLVLPSQAVGLSPEHMSFAGTLSHRAETLIASWTEIGHSVAAAGLRKLILLNSHGGQPQVVDIVTQCLRSEAGLLAVRANTFRFELPENLISERERSFGLHGGQIETALMLAIAPELVRRELISDFPNRAEDLAAGNKRLGLSGAGGLAWNAEDLNPSGATGAASLATAEDGAAILTAYGHQLAELIGDVADWPLSDGAPFGAPQ